MDASVREKRYNRPRAISLPANSIFEPTACIEEPPEISSAEAVEGCPVVAGKPARPVRYNRRSYDGPKVSFSSDNVFEDDLGDDLDLAEGTENAAQSSQQKEKSSLSHRSRSFGAMPKIIADAISKLEEKSHVNRDKQFHKLFGNIPQEELLLRSFSGALLGDVLLQGRMFISTNWVCFYANILGYESKVIIAVSGIRSIHKMKTAFVVPNAISIHTDTTKYVFGSLLSRRATYKTLVQVLKGDITHEDEDKSTCSQDGSYSQAGQSNLTDDHGFEIVDYSPPESSEETAAPAQKKLSRRRAEGIADALDDRQNTGTSGPGNANLSTYAAKVKCLADSLRTMQLVLPLVILVICCLAVSSLVLSYRIERVRTQLENNIPDMAVAVRWNGLLQASQSGHIEQVSKLRDSLLLSLQTLNKMHSSWHLLQRSTANERETLHH